MSGPQLDHVEELAGAKRLLDIGGGNGTNAFRLAERFPQLHITIFDLPSVCALARKEIAARKLSHRISTISGNFLRDAVPKGFDAILIAHLLTIYSEAKNIKLLSKCHRALPEGGILVNLDDHVDDEETNLDAAVLSLYFLVIATGEGMIPPFADYARWFAAAGFGRVRPYTGLPGIIVARKRRSR
jgi:ubiquinone/menaquinone biosynthesis C-methylase UbiE